MFVVLLIPLAGFLAYSDDALDATKAPVVGLNQIDYVGFDGHGHDQLHLADKAGIHWVRHGVWWWDVEGKFVQWDPRDWSDYDSLFSDLRDRLDENGDTAAFEIVPVFAGMPEWAADTTCMNENDGSYRHCPPAPEHMGDWKDFLETFADRYDYIDYYEVWNEAYCEEWNDGDPDGFFFKGTPSQLIEMTDSLDAAIKRRRPSGRLRFPRSKEGGRRNGSTVRSGRWQP